MKQSQHSKLPGIRIIDVTCLYGNCTGIVRDSRNHLTNVFAIMEPDAGLILPVNPLMGHIVAQACHRPLAGIEPNVLG
jgi:hypothetical protein